MVLKISWYSRMAASVPHRKSRLKYSKQIVYMTSIKKQIPFFWSHTNMIELFMWHQILFHHIRHIVKQCWNIFRRHHPIVFRIVHSNWSPNIFQIVIGRWKASVFDIISYRTVVVLSEMVRFYDLTVMKKLIWSSICWHMGQNQRHQCLKLNLRALNQ